MNYTFILDKILSVFEECGVNSFPLDCANLISQYGYRVFTYQELKIKSPELYDICVACSDDAFRDMATKTVAYNTEAPKKRMYFSLAHELGHIVLGHLTETAKTEAEANFFASNILAPRMAIHYAQCKNEADVTRIFEISCEAAQYAFDDYRRWRRSIVSRRNRMTSLDRLTIKSLFTVVRSASIVKKSLSIPNGEYVRNVKELLKSEEICMTAMMLI